MSDTAKTTEKISIEEMTINTIRTLSMDAVQKASADALEHLWRSLL